MLKSLQIKNYALIDHLSINLENGFNILTGETGAGKSIILGALGLILGQRADLSVLRKKDKKCTVEGYFSIHGYKLEEFFEKADLDYDETTILRREIIPSGKSRAFVNDTPVTLDVIRKLALKLIDIHSQHQNLELNNRTFQLSLIDLVAANDKYLSEYYSDFELWQKTSNQLEQVKDEAEKSRSDLDYFKFQFNQLDEAKLEEGEQEELETEQATLEHAEDIKLSFVQLADDLEGGEVSVLNKLKENTNRLSKLVDYLPEASSLHERLESCYLELKDMADESHSIAERTEHSPDRIQLVAERLDLIFSLQQKFRSKSIAELLETKLDLETKIVQVTTFDEEIVRLESELEKQYQALIKKAEVLSERRIATTDRVRNRVVDILHKLNMLNAEFVVQIDRSPKLGITGFDEVRFLFSANKSSSPQEISKIASGGEMSRLMLALKSLITDSKSLPTIIFDEIDTGISGETAVKMGDILKNISGSMQVVNITHLPQIAAKGDHHYQVYKFDEADETFTSIRKLDDDQRIEELAQMLSGDRNSERARETARELLN